MNKTYEICGKTTMALFESHGKAFFARDFEGIATDFPEDGFVILNGKVYKGKENLIKVFKHVTNIFDNCGKQTEFEPPVFHDEVIYLKWRFVAKDQTVSMLGTDTFVVLNGKIHSQTVCCDIFDQIPLKE